MIPEPFVIKKYQRESHDSFSIWLEPKEAKKQLSFKTGQFNMLYVFGVGEVAISISGDPENQNAYVHTIKAVGSVTHVMKELKEGATIGVRGPFGSAWPSLESLKNKDILLVTGGLGMAPLRPVLYQIIKHRDQMGKLSLIFGAREPAGLIYKDELTELSEQKDFALTLTVDNKDANWQGCEGLVTKYISLQDFDPKNTVVMTCGPEIMMKCIASECEHLGVDPNNIYLSLERNMKCALGFCGHCQFGPEFICKDGPVFSYNKIRQFLEVKEF